MLDYDVYAVYGWKVTGDEVKKMIEQLNEIDEYYSDKLSGVVMIEDYMCGDYVYFGAMLGHLEICGSSCDFEINNEIIKKKVAVYNKFMDENPNYAKVFNQYNNNESVEPKLMVFLHIS